MENWVFGCDICQDVCPWNKRKPRSLADPRFAPRPGNIGRRIEDWSGLTAEEYRERFRGSAVKRSRHDGFVRNIEIIAENMRRRKRGKGATQ
jgi:epoxyqueuosine reductase